MSSYVRFGPLVPITSYHGSNTSNISGGCPDGIQWIWTIMGDCAVSPREQASAYVGLISMLTWMMVSIPQIIKNCMNINGLAGVSFFLIFQWTAGDTTNLIGAILTNQLKPQIYLACFFVASDLVLLSQYLLYYIRKRRLQAEQGGASGVTNSSQLVLCLMGLLVFSQFFIENLFPSSWRGVVTHDEGMVSGRLSRSLLSTRDSDSSQTLFFVPHEPNIVYGDSSTKVHSSPSFWHNPKDIVGYVIGVISSIFYLGSRTSQILKNYKSASTEGLAIMTFILAVIGNITYGGQILIQSLDGNFLLKHTPWLIGSLGVIGLDCTLLGQFYYYSRRGHNLDEERQKLLSSEHEVNAVEPSVQS